MAISGDYPSPVNVNGFSCRNCAEVDQAKKFIDPKHPKDGPFGINAKDQKPGAAKDASHRNPSPSVVFGGQLAGLAAAQATNATGSASALTSATYNSNATSGTRLDISA
jgi:hypothetical protein